MKMVGPMRAKEPLDPVMIFAQIGVAFRSRRPREVDSKSLSFGDDEPKMNRPSCLGKFEESRQGGDLELSQCCAGRRGVHADTEEGF